MPRPILPRSFDFRGDLVRSAVLTWFAESGRSFPWRTANGDPHAPAGVRHDPWLVLVSEVMLQQTQAERVVEKLTPFLERFPGAIDLAMASTADVVTAWRGLGYNSRGLRLRQCAIEIANRHGGAIPSNLVELRALPGVGEYTARAVACFAFGAHVAPVDVNVARVLSRLFYGSVGAESVRSADAIDHLATALVPQGEAYAWSQALMDLGATICTARRPNCTVCPVGHLCLGRDPLRAQFFRQVPLRSEPSLHGTPRRVWRGRLLDELRDAKDGIVGSVLVAVVIDKHAVVDPSAGRSLLEVVAALIAEGFVETVGAVGESGAGLSGSERLRLKQ